MALVALSPARAQQAPEVPVIVGDDVPVDLPSCSLGMVTGLDPQGDNFLAVRGGPGTGHAQIDALHQQDAIFVCESRGRWMGIVYEPGARVGGPASQCGVPAPVSPRQPYVGPCRSGWVYDGYVVIVAG
jgi:hypothetical protein